MTRIVNRVPTLRKPRIHGTGRLLADIKACGGFDQWLNIMLRIYGDTLLDHTAQTYGSPAADHIIRPFLEPFNPFDATSWLTSVHGEETHQ